MKVAKLAFLCLAVAAHAVAFREGIIARDLTGTYSSFFRTDACPRKVYHRGVVSGGNAMSHGEMSINGVACVANGELQLLPLSKAAEIRTAVNQLGGEAQQLAAKVVGSAPGGSYVGVSNVARVCGNVTLPPKTLVVFAKSAQEVPLGVDGFPPLPAKKRLMVVVQPGKDTLCPYTAKLRESPSPRPIPKGFAPGATVSPSPSPTISTTPSPSPAKPATDGVTTGQSEASVAPSPEVGGSVCFPRDAVVSLRDGSTKAMGDLVVGDEVAVGAGEYSPVFMFTHKLRHAPHTFVVLSTASGHSITLTPGHYVILDDGSMRTACAVRVGDVLTLHDGNTSAVTRFGKVRGTGLYNPQTAHGAIVVNGIVASTYTKSVAADVAHPLLAPLRAAWLAAGYTLRFLEGGADKMAALMPKGAEVA